MGNRAWLLLCLLVSLAGTPGARSGDALPLHPPLPMVQAAEPRAEIVFRDGRLSVSTHAAPWEEVLQELERYTGIQIRVKGPLAGTLTQAFEALPLEPALRRLFREVNTVFFYASGPHAQTVAAPLTEVWLVPKDGGAAARMLPSAGEPAGTALLATPDPQQDSLARSLRQEEPSAAGDTKEDEREDREEDEEEEAGTEQK
jgi:hypothetical protein